MNVLTSARGGSGIRVWAWKRTKFLHSPIFILFYDFTLTFFFPLVVVMLPLKWYSKVRAFLYRAWSSSFLVLGTFLPICHVSLLWHLLKYLIPFKHLKHLRQAHTHTHSHASKEEKKNENEPKYCGCIGVDATRLPATLLSFRSMVRDEAASVGLLSKSLAGAENKTKKKVKHVRVSSGLWSYAVLVPLMPHRVHVFFWRKV